MTDYYRDRLPVRQDHQETINRINREYYTGWFRRTTGRWTSERRYLMGPKKNPLNLTTEFSIGALTEGDWDYQVNWTGQTNGTMNLKLIGNELHRDIGYYPEDPTVSRISLVDIDTLVLSTTYGGRRFREEIRLLEDDRLRLRQTVGYDENTNEVIVVGQYFEERIL